MNFLFLDVDGVLNCQPYCKRTRKDINEENIKEAFGVRALIENVKTKDGIEKIMIPYSLV